MYKNNTLILTGIYDNLLFYLRERVIFKNFKFDLHNLLTLKRISRQFSTFYHALLQNNFNTNVFDKSRPISTLFYLFNSVV